MIGNILLESPSGMHKQMTSSVQSPRAVAQNSEAVRSSRSSLRQFNVVMGSQPQASLAYLALEQEADADLARGSQLVPADWNYVYRERWFFKGIANRYAEAASMAVELSQLQDAVRILEKQASVYVEKLDSLYNGFELLLDARKLCEQIGDREKSESLVQKLHALADEGIAFSRAELSESTNDWGSTRLISALLRKADLLEMTGFPGEACPLYEEAGHLCLRLEEEGTAFGKLSAALITGLCFEKSDKTQDLARTSYEKVLELMEPLKALFREQHLSDSDETKLDREFYKTISFAPVCLEISLASLKCGRTDLFVEVTTCQVEQFISLLQLLPDDWKEFEEIEVSAEYMSALLNVSEALLGPDPVSDLKTKLEQAIDFDIEEKPIRRQNAEKALLALFTAPKETSVKEMQRRLDHRGQFLGP